MATLNFRIRFLRNYSRYLSRFESICKFRTGQDLRERSDNFQTVQLFFFEDTQQTYQIKIIYFYKKLTLSTSSPPPPPPSFPRIIIWIRRGTLLPVPFLLQLLQHVRRQNSLRQQPFRQSSFPYLARFRPYKPHNQSKPRYYHHSIATSQIILLSAVNNKLILIRSRRRTDSSLRIPQQPRDLYDALLDYRIQLLLHVSNQGRVLEQIHEPIAQPQVQIQDVKDGFQVHEVYYCLRWLQRPPDISAQPIEGDEFVFAVLPRELRTRECLVLSV